jgi:hypothetical protein
MLVLARPAVVAAQTRPGPLASLLQPCLGRQRFGLPYLDSSTALWPTGDIQKPEAHMSCIDQPKESMFIYTATVYNR